MNKELTYENKLQAIIKAQILGGHNKWEPLYNAPEELCWVDKDDLRKCRTLMILLDTDGLKAAYGEEYIYCPACKTCNRQTSSASIWETGHLLPAYLHVSIEILRAWQSGEGNNWQAAIDTAYKLLPKNRSPK